jgi:TonB-dependent receptor
MNQASKEIVMVRILLLVSALLLLSPSVLMAAWPVPKNVNIEGIVKDSQTGDPLPGANVVLAGTSLGASADINGKYTIRNVPPGTYTVSVTYVGYRSVSVTLLISEGATVKQDFKLVAVSIEGETVVVTAQASGQNAAINQQLASNQITNVVSAARIQELPDANAAESVGRLPGVSVLRNGGEGTQVVIRGLQPKYNSITIDGVRMASSSPNDRSTDLSMISPYSLEGIEVTKAVTADQDADALGGSVNFKMREAKGEQAGLGYNLLVQGGYNGLSDVLNKYNNYRYVGSVDGRFFDERFGVFAQADLERRNLGANAFSAAFGAIPQTTADYLTNTINLNYVARDRQRANGTLVLDYRLPEGKISLTNFLSSGSTDVQNRGESYDVQGNVHNYSLAFATSTQNQITNALTIEHPLSLFNATLRLSHSYSETKDPDDWGAGFQQGSAGLGQYIGGLNLYPQDVVKVANNIEDQTFLGSLVSSSSYSRERALTASLDLETNVNVSDLVSSVIKFGGKYRRQTRSYTYDQYTGQGLGLISASVVDKLIATHFASTLPYANTTQIPITPFLDPGFSYGKFLGGDFRMGLPLNYAMIAEMARYVRSQADFLAAGNSISYFHDSFNSTINNYDGHEDQSAVYAMATINIGPEITIIPGVRFQDLKTSYTASRGQQTTLSATGGAYRHSDTTLTEDHGYWLPDVILRYKPLSWFDVRLSYTNTLAYPDYNAVVPKIDLGQNVIIWNNYKLKPSRSTNYDAYVSFYDNSIGLFTVGGFLKRITDLIYPWTYAVSDSGALPYFPNLYPPPLLNTGVYSVTTFVNDGYRIDDYGMEFDWQTHFWYLPRPFDGLVLNVNYTHIFSKAQYPYTDLVSTGGFRSPKIYVDTTFTDRLLFQPDDIVNLSLGYDFEGFSIRVSMLYQSDIFTGPNYYPQLRTHTSSYTRWDLSVKQTLPWFGIQLYGDINNINAVSDLSVISAPTGASQSQQSYGLTADLGIRWHF